MDNLDIQVEEIWKDISGCNNYQISNLGKVKSKQRIVNNRLRRERILKPSNNKKGYLQINIKEQNIKILLTLLSQYLLMISLKSIEQIPHLILLLIVMLKLFIGQLKEIALLGMILLMMNL